MEADAEGLDRRSLVNLCRAGEVVPSGTEGELRRGLSAVCLKLPWRDHAKIQEGKIEWTKTVEPGES